MEKRCCLNSVYLTDSRAWSPGWHLSARCCWWTLYIACLYVWSGSAPPFLIWLFTKVFIPHRVPCYTSPHTRAYTHSHSSRLDDCVRVCHRNSYHSVSLQEDALNCQHTWNICSHNEVRSPFLAFAFLPYFNCCFDSIRNQWEALIIIVTVHKFMKH